MTLIGESALKSLGRRWRDQRVVNVFVTYGDKSSPEMSFSNRMERLNVLKSLRECRSAVADVRELSVQNTLCSRHGDLVSGSLQLSSRMFLVSSSCSSVRRTVPGLGREQVPRRVEDFRWAGRIPLHSGNELLIPLMSCSVSAPFISTASKRSLHASCFQFLLR